VVVQQSHGWLAGPEEPSRRRSEGGGVNEVPKGDGRGHHTSHIRELEAKKWKSISGKRKRNA
jgi:hypothetical protein